MKEVTFKLPDEVLTLIVHKVANTPQEASLLEKWIYDGEECKTGHWISDDPFHKKVTLENGQVSCSCHCSECGDWLVASDEYPCRGYYCPNCGARMEVGDVRKSD